jgi:hypothetical protein
MNKQVKFEYAIQGIVTEPFSHAPLTELQENALEGVEKLIAEYASKSSRTDPVINTKNVCEAIDYNGNQTNMKNRLMQLARLGYIGSYEWDRGNGHQVYWCTSEKAHRMLKKLPKVCWSRDYDQD